MSKLTPCNFLVGQVVKLVTTTGFNHLENETGLLCFQVNRQKGCLKYKSRRRTGLSAWHVHHKFFLCPCVAYPPPCGLLSSITYCFVVLLCNSWCYQNMPSLVG